MKTAVLLSCAFLTFSLPAMAQGHGWPRPPEPAVSTQQPVGTPVKGVKGRFDAVQLQREARELSDLANSLPLDIEHVSHGLLPKDMMDKLKRIEKLSKHLRSEITP
jgi:hypothetical protein